MGLLDIAKIAAPLAGSLIDTGVSLFGANQANKFQESFARNSLRWRVRDARRAGIHPLAALGFNSMMPSPVGINTNFQGMGQDISRAIKTKMSDLDRKALDLKLQLAQGQVDHQNLINDALRKDLNKSTQLPPSPNVDASGQITSQPLPGQSDPMVPIQPSPVPAKGSMGRQAGVPAQERGYEDTDGFIWMMPSQDTQDTLSEGLMQIPYYGKKFFNWVETKRIHRYPSDAEASRDRDKLRKIRRTFKKKKGYVIRFNRTAGMFQYVPDDGKNQFYTDVPAGSHHYIY